MLCTHHYSLIRKSFSALKVTMMLGVLILRGWEPLVESWRLVWGNGFAREPHGGMQLLEKDTAQLVGSCRAGAGAGLSICGVKETILSFFLFPFSLSVVSIFPSSGFKSFDRPFIKVFEVLWLWFLSLSVHLKYI